MAKRRADWPPSSPPGDEDGVGTVLPDEVWCRVFTFIPNALSTIGAMGTTAPCMRALAETLWAETVDAIDLRHPPIRLDNAVLRTVARRWRRCPNLRTLDVDCMQTTIGKQMCVMELAEEDTRRGLHRVLLHHDH